MRVRISPCPALSVLNPSNSCLSPCCPPLRPGPCHQFVCAIAGIFPAIVLCIPFCAERDMPLSLPLPLPFLPPLPLLPVCLRDCRHLPCHHPLQRQQAAAGRPVRHHHHPLVSVGQVWGRYGAVLGSLCSPLNSWCVLAVGKTCWGGDSWHHPSVSITASTSSSVFYSPV